MKRHVAAIEELWMGYQAVADAHFGQKTGRYGQGYIDGWADAMNHAAWAAEGKRVKPKRMFELLSVRSMRKAAVRSLKARRDAS